MTTPLTASTPPPNGATRIIRRRAVRWRGRTYTAAWMAAYRRHTVRVGSCGPDAVEVFDAVTGQPLGTAYVQQPISPSPPPHTHAAPDRLLPEEG